MSAAANTTGATADVSAALLRCIEAAELPGQPQPLYRAVDATLNQVVGHRLFTMMVLARDGVKVRRVYSSRPDVYPVGGFKTHRQTPWGRQVLGEGRPYIGRNADDIRWGFADADQIFSLGCESILNLPVKWDGRVLGTLNLLERAGFYDAKHLVQARPFAALLVAAFQFEIAAA